MTELKIPIRNILLLCNLPELGADANTILDHILAFTEHSKHKIWLYSNVGNISPKLDLNKFDVIIIHYSMCLLNNYYISKQSKDRLRAFNGLKIAFVQDEYREINNMISQLQYLKIDVLFSCFPKIEIEKINKENVIYFSGKDAGKLWFIEMNKQFKLKQSEVIKWGSEIVTLAGWGEAIIKKEDILSQTVIFDLNNSVVVKFYGKSKCAVDHLFRGLLAGAMCVVFNEDMEAVEMYCVAKGDKNCEFIVKPRKKFDLSNPTVKMQLKK